MTAFRLLSLTCLAALAAGCGLKRLPNDLIRRLPYESKIELLEAENELALAIDRVDEAQSEVHRTRDALRRAKDRWKAAESEEDDASDELGRSVAKLAVKEAEARVGHLRARQDVNVESLYIAERGLTCALAQFEVARLAVARKAKVEGAEHLDPADFEQQAKSCEEGVKALQAELAEEKQRAQEAKASWDQAKDALAKKTFDARASPYVE